MISTLLRTDRPRALLLVGDFNATWNNKAFRAILGDGLTDGAAARGDPFEMTWSQMMPPLPPFVRIDHVLTGAGVAVVRIGTGDGPGSDHRDIEATVAVRR
jgi:endonuclease/exonuclease/phosphatase family metal-dependent hydrolase